MPTMIPNVFYELMCSQPMILGFGLIISIGGIVLIRAKDDSFGTICFMGGCALIAGIIILLIGIFYDYLF